MTARLTRRQFLLRGAGAGVGLAMLNPSQAMAMPSDDDYDVGVIEDVDPPRSLSIFHRQSQEVRAVRLAEDATVLREGAVTLDAFRQGDRVALQGEWDGSILRATYLAPIYEFVEGVLIARVGEKLLLTTGTFHLTDKSRPAEGPDVEAKPLDALSPGDEIVATGRWEPGVGSILLQIAVQR